MTRRARQAIVRSLFRSPAVVHADNDSSAVNVGSARASSLREAAREFAITTSWAGSRVVAHRVAALLRSGGPVPLDSRGGFAPAPFGSATVLTRDDEPEVARGDAAPRRLPGRAERA